MPQRTIAQATAILEDLGGLSDNDRRTYEAELTAARNQATETATVLMDERVAEIAAVRDDALAELCAVRDGYGDLVAKAQLGRITAADYERSLTELRSRQRAAERHITRTSEALAFVETAEADPVAFGDSLFAKFPLTSPTFSF